MMEIKNTNNNIDAVYLFCVTGIIRSISVSKGGLFSAFLLVSQASSLSPPVKNTSFLILTRQISWSPCYHNSQVDFQKSSLTNLERDH